MATPGRFLMPVGLLLVQAVLAFPATARAELITLPGYDIARLDYTGYETFHDLNGNHIADAGDFFDGIVKFQSIKNAAGTIDLSGQLANKELTAAFRFSVIGGSSSSGHIEFGLLPPDFFRLYVGTGATMNWDPTAPDAVPRATDGDLWLAILPGPFFESVNDRQPSGATLNRAWMNVAINNTGYGLAMVPFPTLLGEDPTHTYQGQVHGDHAVQMYFENSVAGPSNVPGFTFQIFGPVFLEAVPEPSTLTLAGLGALGLLGYARRRGAVLRRQKLS
jgi:hypothetical protein